MCFVLSWIQVRLFWIIWNKKDASRLFCVYYGICYFQKAVFVNLSCVWIIFPLNFKTFFWWYMLSLYLPLQIFMYCFSKWTINMNCNFGDWPQNYLTTLKAFWTSMFHCFRPTIQFYQETCSRTYSIMLARCLWSLFLTFTMVIKLSIMIV